MRTVYTRILKDNRNKCNKCIQEYRTLKCVNFVFIFYEYTSKSDRKLILRGYETLGDECKKYSVPRPSRLQTAYRCFCMHCLLVSYRVAHIA